MSDSEPHPFPEPNSPTRAGVGNGGGGHAGVGNGGGSGGEKGEDQMVGPVAGPGARVWPGEDGGGKPRPRVVLWAVPRSVSTAFFRAIMSARQVKACTDCLYINSYFCTHCNSMHKFAIRPPAELFRMSRPNALHRRKRAQHRDRE